jgi:hypothetical protein
VGDFLIASTKKHHIVVEQFRTVDWCKRLWTRRDRRRTSALQPTRAIMRSLRVPVSIVLIPCTLLILACGGGGGSTAPPPQPVSVNGAWTTFVDSLRDVGNAIVCNDTGSVTFNQTNGTIVAGSQPQTGTCYQPGPVDNSGTSQITAGSVTAPANGTATINFTEDGLPPCQYTGTVTGSPATAGSGTVNCTGSGFAFTGTWHMSR